jgi:hypothetical protein
LESPFPFFQSLIPVPYFPLLTASIGRRCALDNDTLNIIFGLFLANEVLSAAEIEEP